MNSHGVYFPAARDEDASSSLLFRFVCNNLYFGQWELARACIDTLRTDDVAAKQQVASVLLDCAKSSVWPGYRTEGVPNPQTLAWLALKEYEQLTQRDALVEKLERAIELRLLLIAVSSVIVPPYASELCESADVDSSSGHGVALSAQCLELLQKLLRQQPSYGVRLLQLVFGESGADPRFEETILSALDSALDDLCACPAEDVRQIESLNKTCYDMLAALGTASGRRATTVGGAGGRISQQQQYQQKQQWAGTTLRRQVFQRIIDLMATESRLVLTTGAVYGALLSGRRCDLLNCFCEVEDDCLSGLSSACPPVARSPVTNLSYKSHTQFVHWRVRVKSTLTLQQDFLSAVLERCQRIAAEKQFSELGNLVDAAEMSMIAPMVLQTAWQYTGGNSDSCRSLLAAFAQLEHRSEALTTLLEQLAFYADVTDWCAKLLRPSEASAIESSLGQACAGSSRDETRMRSVLLGALQSGSLLRALSTCVGLKTVDDNELRHHLRSGPIRHAVKEKASDAERHRRHQLSLFDAFCAVRRFAEIILHGSHLTPSDMEAMAEAARNALLQIRPVTLRLEVVEDAFALLFACHTDVTDSDHSLLRGKSSDESDKESDGLKAPLDDTNPASSKASNDADRSRRSRHDDTSASDGEDDQLSPHASTASSTGAGRLLTGSAGRVTSGMHFVSGTATDEQVGGMQSLQPGFLATPAIVKCILQALMRAVSDICTEHRQGCGNRDTEYQNDISTVSWDDYERHLSLVQQYLNEAWWRFQIVVDAQTITGPCGSSSSDNASYTSDDELSRYASSRGNSQPGDRPGKDATSHSIVESKRLRRHGRPDSRTSRCHGAIMRPQALWKESAISLMLAQPASMVARCLTRGQAVRAKKVVETCMDADCSLSREVAFGDRYAAALQRLWSASTATQPTKQDIEIDLLGLRHGGSHASILPLTSSGYSLGFLGDLAAAGAAAASSSAVADELLSSGALPDMAIDWSSAGIGPSLSAGKGVGNVDECLRFHLSNTLVASCVLLDLASVGCRDAEQCCRYLASALERLPTGFVSRSEDSSEFPGSLGFLRRCYSLMAASDRSEIARFALVAKTPQSTQPSLADLLLGLMAPFDADALRGFLATAIELEQCENQLGKIIRASGDSDGSASSEHMERRLMTLPGGKMALSPPSTVYLNLAVEQASRAVTTFRAAFKSFACCAAGRQNGSVKINAEESQHANNCATFLLCMFNHCKALRGLMDVQTSKDRERIMDTNCFAILKQSPTLIMGRLIFERGVSPLRLEPEARKLQLDLTHIIVRSCCRPVPCKVPRSSHPEIPLLRNTGLPMILNQDRISLDGLTAESVGAPPLTTSPLRLAEQLLEEMISVVQSALSKSPDSYCGVLQDRLAGHLHSSSAEYAAVARNTAMLGSVSLASIKSEDEKICFFVNVLNLLYLHGLIHCLAMQETPSEDKAGFITYSSSIAYKVGELGVVSAFELEHFIIRCGMPLEFSRIKLSEFDPWQAFAPKTTCDWRVTFLISRGTASSRPPKVVRTAELAIMLSTEAELSIASCIRFTDGRVEMAEELILYTQDIPADSITTYEKPYAALLRRLCAAADTSTRQALEATLVALESATPPAITGDQPAGNRVLFSGYTQEAPAPSVAIVVVPSSYELGYAFDPALGPSQLSLTASFSAASLTSESCDADSRASSSVYRLTRCDSQLLQRQTDFVLSDQAIQYLYDRSPVAGCLVDLLCLDRDVGVFDAPTGRSQPSVADVLKRPACMSEYLEVRIIPLVAAALASGEATPLASPDDSADSAEILDVAAKFPEIADVIRATLLTRRSDPTAVLRRVVTRLFEKRHFTSLLHLLYTGGGMDTVGDARHGLEYHRLKDYVLMRLACESYSRQSADYARQIANTGLQAHVILACLGSWPADICVDMLQLSEQRLKAGEPPQQQQQEDDEGERRCSRAVSLWPCLLRSVSAVLDEMKLYLQIIGHANNLLSDYSRSTKETSDGDAASGVPSIEFLNSLTKGWQSVREAVRNETGLALQTLYAAADFESAVKLTRRHPGSHTEAACENYLLFLLTKDKPEFVRAEKLLESILSEDGDRCYAVSEGVLKRLRSQECILFVTRFLLNRLASRLGMVQHRKLRATNLGAKMLLQLPDQARAQCANLVSAPMLMLEQLLMNSQIEWARTAVQVLRSSDSDALPAGTDDRKSKGGSQSLSMAGAIDELVERYAEKALDYPLVITKDTATGDGGSSGGQARRMAAASAAPGKTGAGSPIGVPSSSGVKSVPSSGKFSPTGTSIPKVETLKRISSSIGLSIPSPGMISVSPATPLPSTFSHIGGAAKKAFVIPDEPPSKDQWVDDADASECMVCRVERFSMFNRRHHCRRCGRVVCSSCSSKTSVVNGIVSRVCDECFAFLQQPKNIPPGLERMKRIVERHSGNLGGGGSPIVDSSPSAGALTSGSDVGMTVDYVPEQQEWELTLDEKKNQAIREEFYYDFAPSTSLCVSLLDLHSDMRRSGQKMLQLCDSQLAKLLVPLRLGQENSEVDYSWVVSMMQFLVFNAKVRLAKCFDAEGQGSCDLYNSRVDILDLLVNANYHDIPAMQELTKMDSLRRLRDRLVEDERPTLAMEVSTKSGLDPSGAWAAWGFACLKSGDFPEARDKFSRCLKVPVDLNQQHQQSTKLVGDIVAAIESSQCASSANVQSLLSAVQDVRSLIAEPSVPPRSLISDDVRMQECLYYLKTYGSHFALVEFYRKNGFLQKAVQYILDKECSPEVFVECLLMPSLSEGELSRLQDNLLMIDRTLEKWGPYLLAACRHLSRHNYINVLYEVQLFMKDYIRAAMTCIRQLYLRGAKTYADLHQRLTYLEKARSHLKAYLDPRQWGTVAKPPLGFAVTKLSGSADNTKAAPNAVVMVQSPDEVNRHINTVDLQVDVTKFMYRHEQLREGVALASAPSSSTPVMASPFGGDYDHSDASSIGGIPTLFGSNRMRADVVVAVMSASGNPNDSFGLAFRIVQDFGLDYAQICMRVARTLVTRRNFTGVRQLLDCIRTSGLKGEGLHDEIVLTALRVIGSDEQQSKEIDNLIKLIRTDANRIEANIICGRLKSAYLVAVKADSVEDVRRIAEAAKLAGQSPVAAICEKWLKSRTAR